jgi:hypothetical protein
MADEPQKDEATKAGDELLRRLLKTPPAPLKPKKRRLDATEDRDESIVKDAGKR